MKSIPACFSFRLPSALVCALLPFAAIVSAASGAEPAPAEEMNLPVPIISMDEMVQKELLNLDKILAANPKLEEELRMNLDDITQEKYRAKSPEIDALLRRRPGIVRALKTERNFLIHRSIARLARSRVTRGEAIALDEFLTTHPDIAKALEKKPSQIVNADFLIAHPQLGDFFEKHPALSSVLLQRSDKKASGAKNAAPKK